LFLLTLFSTVVVAVVKTNIFVMSKLESHFSKFKKNIIGNDLYFDTPYGRKKMIYADWVASGRLYKPIEERIQNVIGPYVANTHTETSETGTMMTKAYHYTQQRIKKHVNAGPDDVIIMDGSGMTSVINKFQRILGLKSCARIDEEGNCLPVEDIPVVFITHMEHHSNHTSWVETICDVVILNPDSENRVDPSELERQLEKYKDRHLKFGAFTAASNVTGVEPPYYELAKIMHKYGGYAFIDYAGAGPYVDINMHPEDKDAYLDAVFFSPHKFLGGPGTSGVMVFNKYLYNRTVPDHPGGGTVEWTNPWGEHKYFEDIEMREDGGTPGFLQAMRTAMAIEIKEQMDTKLIRQREKELVDKAFDGFTKIPGLHILADNVRERLGIFSFYVDGIHYNLIVKLLNDRFGIQTRGGCACAGTYGHFLLGVSREESQRIVEKISSGDLSEKPGFVRVSLHPTLDDEELDFIIDAVKQIVENIDDWVRDYSYDKKTNEWSHYNEKNRDEIVKSWFSF
jgi:selenocysteine lyase/cysteine desulfurase